MALIEAVGSTSKENTSGGQYHHFHCPGCGCSHQFKTGPGGWIFNEDPVEPTVTPSLLINKDHPARRCHLFVTKGKLVYLQDCHHDLAGKTVGMVAL